MKIQPVAPQSAEILAAAAEHLGRPHSSRDWPAPLLWRTFQSAVGAHVLVLEGSQIFDIDPDLIPAFEQGDPTVTALLAPALAQGRRTQVHQTPDVAPQSLSLNVSASCNLSCSYCYAAQGRFGGAQAAPMAWEVARGAIERLLTGADPTAPVTVGFLGGEPFVNRSLIHRAVRYAAHRGRALGHDVRFAVTTNGTLLTPADLDLLRGHPFAVTVSIDGDRQIQEAQRPGFPFDRLVQQLQPLLADPGLAQVSARSTVQQSFDALNERYDAIHALGFQDIGFSPVRVGKGCLGAQDWPRYLDACVALGRRELGRLLVDQTTAFSNLVIALRQLHRGHCAPYPCGAGGGYFSVAVDGSWYACHRAIGNSDYALGNNAGLNQTQRQNFLQTRHVDVQTDCQSCWARYLCSGSCHQEAAARTTASCNFIRNWLDFCLDAYCTLSHHQPQWFSGDTHGRQS